MGIQELEQQTRQTQSPKEKSSPDIKDQEWFKKLDENQQGKVTELFGKIDDLTKKLDGFNAEGKYKGQASQSLFANIKANPDMQHDEEAQATIELYKFYRDGTTIAIGKAKDIQNEIQKMEKMVKAITTGVEQMSSAQLEMQPEAGQKKYESQVSYTTDISKMSNADILALEPKERLKYITNPKVESISRDTKDITFTFSMNGKRNDDLYRYTTAGQVLPDEVRTVTSDGVMYERMGISGEFYNPDTKKRLLIKENTKVSIVPPLATAEELNKITVENAEKYNAFINTHESYKGVAYKNIITTAIEKQIEPELFIMVADDRNETFDGTAQIAGTELERYARDFAVAFSRNPPKIDGTKYTLESTIEILDSVAPAGSDDILRAYGYDMAKVQEYKEKNPSKVKYDLNRPDNTVQSAPGEYKGKIISRGAIIRDKMTYCSETARLNLQDLGIRNIKQGNAIDVQNSYGSLDPLPPAGGEGSRVADIFLKTNTPNGQKYGHRVAAYQQGGKWYVLDPYYNQIPGKKYPTEPVPINTYRDFMTSKGHKFEGVHYFS